MPAMLRLRDVKARTGLGRSTIYNHVEQGLLPKQINISARAVGWPEIEIAQVIAARIQGKTDEDIKALVRELSDARRLAASLNTPSAS